MGTGELPPTTAESGVPPNVDPAFWCLSLLRKREFERCINDCTHLLANNPWDQLAWWIKTRALTMMNWLDDTELEEDGAGDVLMDCDRTGDLPRPGTSINRPSTSKPGSRAGNNPGVRPQSSSRRPASGVTRPNTGSRPTSQTGIRTPDVKTAMQGSRPGTTRPVTQSGRFIRLGTASMQSQEGGPFIDAEKFDFKKYARRPSLAKVLCDFILYHDHNPRLALILCSEATQVNDYKDWWWKARLGKCYYQLGLYQDATQQFKSALKMQDMIVTHLELAKVALKKDQPLVALEAYTTAAEANPQDTHLLLAAGRVHEMLNNLDESVVWFKKTLALDSSNIEAIACLAANHFYEDHPEISLRLFRRLLQMGVTNTELWNNLGLSCFFSSQYDLTLSCFERALALANDENMADIWYNIGQVAIGIGDLGLAYQAFKVSISVDPNHAESFNNLGILELRKGNVDQAKNNFQTAARLADHIHEPLFNGGLLAFKLGDFQESYNLTVKALDIYPEHSESLELKRQLKMHFTSV